VTAVAGAGAGGDGTGDPFKSGDDRARVALPLVTVALLGV
jgi:hypothetical protein